MFEVEEITVQKRAEVLTDVVLVVTFSIRNVENIRSFEKTEMISWLSSADIIL